MSRKVGTIQPDYFEALYAADSDPWKFQTSDYERAKYEDTLAMLDRAGYRAALEIGCSIGVFTRKLAGRCRHVTATEPSERALKAAREALTDLGTVTLLPGMMPRDVPSGRFDLVVLSEVLYYLDASDAEEAIRLCCDRLEPGGEIVLCHWLGETDYPLTGDQAAEIALRVGAERGLAGETCRRADYRLDHLRSRLPD